MKVVFLDRDGVINEFPGNGAYVTKVKDFHFIPGSLRAIRGLTESGHKLFVISNQAGVGKGVYSLDKLRRIDAKMIRSVVAAGGRIRKSFYCTHRSNAGCDCRKPGIGLLKKALKSLNKTIAHAQKAFFVGDTEGDIKTGHNAGCKTIFVLSGHEDRRHMRKWTVKPDYIVKDLEAAGQIIQHANSRHSRNSRGRA
ncbi:MAG: HAD-IIIA family hydrolase [Candidatus Omnitrophica bacterium]|nr:HAD-IIIA family hydrolase [Candidatus Omnitrophota bacterium]